jgi:enterochelin esterase family protein
MQLRVIPSLYLRSLQVIAAGLLIAAITSPNLVAQEGRRGGTPAPRFVSPEVSADRHITLRIFAPQAQGIRLTASDIPGVTQATQLTKAENGVWEVTVGPIDPGAYRYNFNIDGVATIDPRNPQISESNNNVWSLVIVPGSDLFDTKDVPHGAVAAVTYKSTALNRFRRFHVYTPPGYEAGKDRYPVFYLLHGAGDNDEAWSSVGRAGIILDNLIAAKKARPMVIVMPAGHTSSTTNNSIGRTATEEFVNDFVNDVMPYVEKHYRVFTDRANTAIAGLSMGGGQTLNVAFAHLDRFAYVGVYSSGLLGAFPAAPAPTGGAAAAPAPNPPPTAAEWEQTNAASLDNAALKKGLRLLWFSTGRDDRLIDTTRETIELFKKHGFSPVFNESPGGHTWLNWRNYLVEFAPQLFQTGRIGTQN